MKNRKIYTIVLFLMLTIAIPLFALPSTSAQTQVWKTFPFIEAVPNPVGVGQKTLINLGLINYLMADGDSWVMSLTITKPDGTSETIAPLKTWSTGTIGYPFTPQTTGTYYLQCSFAEAWYNTTTFRRLMGASTSDKIALIVQNETVPEYPGLPPPAEYWTRPIDSQLRSWYAITGSWVQSRPNNLFAPNNEGPESAHILWSRLIGDSMGGLATGDLWEYAFGHGDAYEGKWTGPLIMGGVLYHNKFESGVPTQQFVAIDLRTGKELWTRTFLNNTRPSFGQVLYWDCLNYRGVFSHLWVSTTGPTGAGQGTVWCAFEALTGEWRMNMTNVPAGTNYYGPYGEILKYALTNLGNTTNPNYRLTKWNTSYVVTQGKTGMAESYGSQIRGVIYNATARGYDLNVSVPVTTLIPGSIIRVFPGDRVIGGNVSTSGVTLWGISLEQGREGTLLFMNTWTAPAEWASMGITSMQDGWAAFSIDDKVGIFWTRENRGQYAFSLDTGRYLWQTTPQQDYKDAWSDTPTLGFGPEKVIAYNKFYSASLGGIVYCYDIKNGKLLWKYEADDPYMESYLGNNWWLIPTFVTDGKIYFGHMEHSALQPMPRGAPFICLNATDGSLIWEIKGAFRQSRWGGRAIIGDSIIATQDTYDGKVYAIGKGPSATTVSAPDTAIPFKTPVMIKGTVNDISPGTEDVALKMRFPRGVPAVSDASMSDWMLYVYKQFPKPKDATGVVVSIDATDPNGNYVHLGDTTSDASGMFSFMFTPENPGKYTIYATFSGSKSYYPSSAQTAIGVMEAPEATAAPTPTPVPTEAPTATPTATPTASPSPAPNPDAGPSTDMYIIAAAAVVIIVVVAAAAVILRKRK